MVWNNVFKQVFIGFLASMINTSNFTKCLSFNNQSYMMKDKIYSEWLKPWWIQSRVALLSIYG